MQVAVDAMKTVLSDPRLDRSQLEIEVRLGQFTSGKHGLHFVPGVSTITFHRLLKAFNLQPSELEDIHDKFFNDGAIRVRSNPKTREEHIIQKTPLSLLHFKGFQFLYDARLALSREEPVQADLRSKKPDSIRSKRVWSHLIPSRSLRVDMAMVMGTVTTYEVEIEFTRPIKNVLECESVISNMIRTMNDIVEIEQGGKWLCVRAGQNFLPSQSSRTSFHQTPTHTPTPSSLPAPTSSTAAQDFKNETITATNNTTSATNNTTSASTATSASSNPSALGSTSNSAVTSTPNSFSTSGVVIVSTTPASPMPSPSPLPSSDSKLLPFVNAHLDIVAPEPRKSNCTVYQGMFVCLERSVSETIDKCRMGTGMGTIAGTNTGFSMPDPKPYTPPRTN